MPLSTGDVSSDQGAFPAPRATRIADRGDIEVVGAHEEFDANYESLMTQFVASEWPDDNRKSQNSARRLLGQPIARNLLTIIWKETLVTEDELGRTGMKKRFSANETINCHKLAILLSSEPCDVTSNCTLFRRIIEFANKLDLVARTQCKGRQLALTGTSTLDALMRELAKKNRKALEALGRGGCGDA